MMSKLEKKQAWEMYCEETAGDHSWESLSRTTKEHYIFKVLSAYNENENQNQNQLK